MKKVIHKYTMETKIRMPRGARPLSVAVQKGLPCIWAELDVELVERGEDYYVTHGFLITGTGHEFKFPNPWGDMPAEFLGTILLAEGDLVVHVYYLGEM